MLSENYEPPRYGYRIKLVIAIERNGVMVYQNEFFIPDQYLDIGEAKISIRKDIKKRLQESMYFRSQKTGFDLVHYGNIALTNTYLGYKIVPCLTDESRKESRYA